MSTREENLKGTLKEKYLRGKGQLCPLCDSVNLEASPINIEGDVATQDIGCGSCTSGWTDVYTLTDMEGLEIVPDYLVDDLVRVRGYEGHFTVAAVKDAETVQVRKGEGCAILTVHTADLSPYHIATGR